MSRLRAAGLPTWPIRACVMGQTAKNSPLSASALLSGVILMGWLLACDAWIKILARSGKCEGVQTLGDAVGALWTVPAVCTPLPLAGDLALGPTARAGASPFDVAIPGVTGPLWGLVLLALATVASILLLRWRRRAWGDALALSTLWAGIAMHGLPRLVGPGTSFAELSIGGMGFGLGDLTIGWAVMWIAWRGLAELRG